MPADSTAPLPAASTYKVSPTKNKKNKNIFFSIFLYSYFFKVSPTKSSKLRKQSARRRIKVLDGLPPSRRDELQAYAGQYLPKSSSKKSSARPKKVLHQAEWQT